jgi:hypothetical protein
VYVVVGKGGGRCGVGRPLKKVGLPSGNSTPRPRLPVGFDSVEGGEGGGG